MLSEQQLNQFNDKGYVVIENAVTREVVDRINSEIDRWVNESRDHQSNYGSLIDGQPRFDVESGHCRNAPKLRRITSPQEVSADIKNIVLQGAMPHLLTPILGQNIKFDHCKINAKNPGMKAEVKYHQDHIFEPQSNDSVVVALLMLNDTDEENGCLKVVPGSHKQRYSHARDGKFTGTIDESYTRYFDLAAERIEAKAGSLCIMDTWAVHGSDQNTSMKPRRLLITEYKSADAFPLTQHKLPSRQMDSVIIGKDAVEPRFRDHQEFELPDYYTGDSLFQLQETSADDSVTILPGGAWG